MIVVLELPYAGPERGCKVAPLLSCCPARLTPMPNQILDSPVCPELCCLTHFGLENVATIPISCARQLFPSPVVDIIHNSGSGLATMHCGTGQAKV